MVYLNSSTTEPPLVQEVEALIERGQVIRAQADNGINERSSRSHTILTVWLQTTTSTGNFANKLNLVDLAGSERRGKMGEQGKKIHKEGDAINQSLLSLQRVVMALGRKEKPSFRESKLTFFLQDSLGGNCKTALIACAWGEPDKSSETLSTCKFAESMMKVRADLRLVQCHKQYHPSRWAATASVQVVVNAKKNAGSKAGGNKIKLGPVEMALMEARVQQRLQEEMRKWQAMQQPEGWEMSEEERRQLEEQRKELEDLREQLKKSNMGVCTSVVHRIQPTFTCSHAYRPVEIRVKPVCA
jgi:Kinesin motor domain